MNVEVAGGKPGFEIRPDAGRKIEKRRDVGSPTAITLPSCRDSGS